MRRFDDRFARQSDPWLRASNNGKVSSWLRPAHCGGALQLGLPLKVKNSEFGRRLVASSRLGRARNFRSL